MKKQTGYQWVPVAVVIATVLIGSARADQTAVAFDTTQYWSTGGGQGVYGWQFTTRSDIQISALGIYDNAGIFGGGFPGDGLIEPHVIAIWDVANHSAPLVSSLTPIGTVASLVNGFRYVNTSPIVLPAGHDYVIAAVYPNQDLPNQDFTTGDYNNPGFALTVSPELEFGGYRSGSSDVLSFPEDYTPGHLYAFGPNFTYSVVPEPSTLTLFVLAATALFGFAKALPLQPGPVRVSPEKIFLVS
jgi:hypothetical protein